MCKAWSKEERNVLKMCRATKGGREMWKYMKNLQNIDYDKKRRKCGNMQKIKNKKLQNIDFDKI